MTRRGSREGTIRLRPDGRWEARYRSADGRRRSLFTRTRGEAQERLRAALTTADAGIAPVSQRATVGAWLDEWLATHVEGRVRPSTDASYRQVVRLYLVPIIGRVPLAKLSPEHVARMIRELEARGTLSPRTVAYALAVLRIAPTRAVKSGRALRNVATLVDAPAQPRHELRPLTAEQVRTFLGATADSRLGPLYVVAIGTGLRQGELLGLRWQDVTEDYGTLTVSHTLTKAGALADPKTAGSRRTLRLGRVISAALREQRRRQLEDRLRAGTCWSDSGHVFTSGVGTPLIGTNVTHDFQDALARAGLPRQRFHDLRHAAATLLIEAGEDLGVVSRILGHSTVTLTLNTYGHLTDRMTERAAARMDAILEGAG